MGLFSRAPLNVNSSHQLPAFHKRVLHVVENTHEILDVAFSKLNS